jgi:hypothetical protein
LQKDAPLGGAPQVPTVAAVAMVQTPVQQSVARAHTSPCWMQNDAPISQVPFVQSVEQHSVFPPHVLPAVLQLVLSAWHTLPTQECPQHSASDVQA